MKRLIFWIVGMAIYSFFFIWYTNFDGPMRDDEIKSVLQRVGQSDRSPEDIKNLEHFMRTDTGNDFIMVNLLDMNESPPTLPATGPGAGPMELINHYMEHMYPEQLKRASHPIFYGEAIADAIDLVGMGEEARHWERGAIFRYRSRRDLMEIVEDRYQNASILITSQLPLAKWHEIIGEPTFADAILDRIVHNAHRLELEGPSMRKTVAEQNGLATIDQPAGK